MSELTDRDSALPGHQIKLAFAEDSCVASPVGRWVCTVNAHDGRSQQGEVQQASDPAHGLWVWLCMLVCQEGCQSLVHHCGCCAHSAHRREHQRGERTVLNFNNPSFIAAPLLSFMPPVSWLSGGLAVGWCVRVKNPYVEECTRVGTNVRIFGIFEC